MASNKRGRRKMQVLIQKNRLDSYFALKKTKSDGDEVVSDIIDELIISSVILAVIFAPIFLTKYCHVSSRANRDEPV